MLRSIATICLVFTSLSITAEEQNQDDKAYKRNAVGFHHHGNPTPISTSKSDASKYFLKGRPFLSDFFRQEVLAVLLRDIAGQEFKPKRTVPIRDSRCFAEVSQISKMEVYVKILKPLGAWRWHHHFQCLAIYKIQRNKAIDEIFSVEELYAKLSFTYLGIGHGMGGPDIFQSENRVSKMLGRPDYVYPSQSPSFGQSYYKKHDLHIVTHNRVIYYVEKGQPDWVDYMKKEKTSNKKLKATDKPAP